jgi:hypothetical protein
MTQIEDPSRSMWVLKIMEDITQHGFFPLPIDRPANVINSFSFSKKITSRLHDISEDKWWYNFCF